MCRCMNVRTHMSAGLKDLWLPTGYPSTPTPTQIPKKKFDLAIAGFSLLCNRERNFSFEAKLPRVTSKNTKRLKFLESKSLRTSLPILPIPFIAKLTILNLKTLNRLLYLFNDVTN